MDPYELALRQELGLSDAPVDEGSDPFQFIRTGFGATQGALPAFVSGLMPEQYAAAQQELRQNLGVDEASPWYEKTEALPGAGDVAAQFIPEGVKESLPGRVLGPVARMAGNIAGDPTTYVGGLLVKAGTKIAAGSKAGLAALRAAEVADTGVKAKALAAAELGQISGREAVQAIDQARRAGLTEVTRALMAESPVRGRAFMAARAIKEAEPYALGTAAAVAYGPQVLRAGLESGKETLRAASEGDIEQTLVSGGNTLLMAGLGTLMGKGLIDTAKAKSVLTRELADQGLMPDVDKLVRERAMETGVAPDLTPVQMPPVARPAARRAPFGETPMPETLPPFEGADLLAPRRFRGPVGGDWEALQAEVNAAEPLGGPAPTDLPPRPVQVPEGFRGRVLSDEELLARIQEAGERGRALAREQVRPVVPEGAAGGPLPDQFVSGRRFELELADLTAPRRFRGPVGGRGLEGLQEEVRAAGPVEGPLPSPLRTVEPEIPSGFRGRVLSDAELVARLQAESERARALALEETRAAAPEGAAGNVLPDQFVSGRRFEPPPFVGQTVLPGVGIPRPLPPPEAAPRPRKTGAQLPLDLGEGQTIRKPPSAAERRAAEAAAVEAKVTDVFKDPAAQALVDDEARILMRQEVESLARLKGKTKGREAAEKKNLLAGDPNDPRYQEWFAEKQAVASGRLKTRMRALVKGELDPAEMLRAKRAEMDAAAEREAIVEADQPGVVDTAPAPWDTAAEPVPAQAATPAASRIPLVETEAAPAAPEPPAPAPEAPAAATEIPPAEPGFARAPEPPAAPAAVKPITKPSTVAPEVAASRLARTPEKWVESVLSEKNEKRAHVRARFEKEPALRGELAQRIGTYLDQARKEAKEKGEEFTEGKARAAAFQARKDFVSERGLDVQEARFPEPAAETDVPSPEGTESQIGAMMRGEGPTRAEVAPPQRNKAGELVQPGGEVRGPRKPPSAATIARRKVAAEGKSLSPAAQQWHEVLRPNIEDVAATLNKYVKDGVYIDKALGQKLNEKNAATFVEFQKLYDQFRENKQTPFEARNLALKTLSGGKAEQYLRNTIGKIEKLLAARELEAAARERGVEPPAPAQKAAPPVSVETLRERKAAVDHDLSHALAAFVRGEEGKAGMLEVLQRYARFVDDRKGLGRGSWGLGDNELRNFAKVILGDDFKLKDRAGADWILDKLARKFGTTVGDLRSAARKQEPQPVATTRAAEARPSELPAGWKPTREAGTFASPRGSKVTVVHDRDGMTVRVYESKSAGELADDVEELVNAGAQKIVRGKGGKVPGWGAALSKLLERNPRTLSLLESEDGVIRTKTLSAGMETRNLLDVAGHDWTKHVDFDDITVGPKGTADDARALADHMVEPEDAWKTVEPVAKGLGLDVNADNPVTPLGRSGWFHQVYLLNGADKNGRQYVMRIGKSPYLELPRPDQRALVNTPVRTGEFKAVTGERFTYSVHPYAWSPGFDINLSELPGREKIVSAFGGYYDAHTLPSKVYEQTVLEMMQGKLPEGIGLADYLEDAAKLNREIERTGLIDGDLYWKQMEWRAGQTGYVKLAPGEAPSGIVRVAPDGSRYKLTVLDLGSVRPQEAKGQWANVPQSMFVALKKSEDELPMSARNELERLFDGQERDALDIGDGLVVARHHGDDGGLGWGYTALVAKYGKEPAKGMRKLVEELVDIVKPRTKVEFKGLTTSPYLSGLYREDLQSGSARIYTNLVEAVHASKNYDDASTLIVDTLTHEVAHLVGKEGVEHKGKFVDLVGYIENLAKTEEWQAKAKQTLKDHGFTEQLYNQIREDLVDQFRAAREAVNGRDWRVPEAQRAPVEGVPGGDTSGSAAAKSNLAGGGAKAPPGGVGAGLRPGRNVPGGGVEPAGGVRPTAAAGERAAAGLAEGIETGSLARKGSDEAESFIAGLESRGPGGGDPTEEAVKIMRQMVSAKLLPVTEQQAQAWKLATTAVDNMSDADVQKVLKSAPDPRGRKDVIAGGINLLYDVPGVSDRGKARMVTFANIMDEAKLTARSEVRPWERVEREVREVLGMTTSEEYLKAFQHKGGGLSDVEHMALVTARDEINREADRLQTAWQKAVDEGDTTAAVKLYNELQGAEHNAAAAITIVQNKLTGAARGLAVGRHARLRMSPLEMLHTRVRSQIDELLQSRVRDAGERARKAAELEQKFFEVLSDRGRWEEYRRALRLAMGRTGMRGAFDKVLEFYKAGLLGWPSEVANLTSNSLFRGSRFTEDTLAALIDAGLYKVGAKKTRDFYLGEVAVGARALRRALMEGMKPLLESELKLFQLQGGDLAKIMEQGSLAQDLMMASGAIGGKVGNFFRFHFDSMQNFDTFAKHLAKTDSLYRDVYRGLRKEGAETVKWLQARKRTGESLVDATERIVGEIRENQSKLQHGLPHDGTLLYHSLDFLERADKAELKDTFQAELGNTGRGLQSLLREHPWMQFLVPFFRTPTNILKETWDRTPAGFVKLAMKWNKLTPEERIQSLSKAALGTSIMGTMAMLAANGEITGGGPLSFEERDALMATGWQPFSVRVGDQWISYQRLEPLSSLVGMAADAMEAYRNGDMDSASATMQKLADSVAENLTNKTFLSGFSALTGAVSDPKRELGSFVKQMQQSVVPNSLGFVPFGHLARGLDPVYRQADPMTWDAFTSKIPFMTQTLDPQYGPTGDERRRVGTAFERTFSPYQRRKIEEGPKARGAEELVRAGAVPKAPLRYWTSPQGFRVPLKPEERQALAKALEEATILIGQRIVKDPGYQRLPKDEMDPEYRYGQKTKQDVLDGIVRRYRGRALDRIKPALKQRSRQMYREREL